MMNTPLIITVAPNGAYKTREQHPEVPLTAADLAQTAKECLDSGASMIHMHVRKPDGKHLLDARAYIEATAAVRKAVGLFTEAVKTTSLPAWPIVDVETISEDEDFGDLELEP